MTGRAPEDVPAVLTMAQYSGTLAAVRCLGARGVPVIMATDQVLAPARWSRWVRRVVPAIGFETRAERVRDWLVAFGRREPGCVLYPTSDDLAWLVSRYLEDLRPYYHLYSPPIQTMREVLNKRALYAACREVGLDTPTTWYPADEAAVRELATEADALVVKPRAQVFLQRHAKGGLARGVEELTRVWRDYRSESFAPEVRADMPDIDHPMVQRYVRAPEGIHSVSGFVDRSGRLLATRGCLKILQEPASVGVGVCFEAAPAVPELIERVAALCRKVGYFGVFEAEFINDDGRHLLIDFNPRYFGQMGFDIARGLPLAWMAHLCALGEEERAAEACAPERAVPRVYRDRVTLQWRLAACQARGVVSSEQVAHWETWLRVNAHHSVDAAVSANDVMPGVAAVAGTVWRTLRHPRSFWRSLR